MTTKVCTRCGQEKLTDKFDHKLGKLRSICKSCVSRYTKQHYLKNKDYYLTKTAINRERARKERREFLLSYYQGHPCVDCGEKDPVVLEFDHIEGKSLGISVMANRAFSINKMKEEIAKCEVVCANCHRRRTAKAFRWYKQSINS